MKRSLPALLAGLVLLMPAIVACAALPKQGPDAPTDPKDIIARFVSVKKSNFQSFPAMAVSVVPVLNPSQVVKLKLFPIDKDKLDFLNDLKAGVYVTLTYAKSGADLMLARIDLYDLKPGEDEPDVFAYSTKTTTTENNKESVQVTVKKFGVPIIRTVPRVRNSEGKMAPKEDMMKAINGFSAGDMVELKSNAKGEIQTIRLYEPPQLGLLEKVDKVKVGNSDLFAAEVKIDGTVQTLAIAKTDIPLINKARAIKNGELVYCRSTTDDKSTWLIEIRPAPPGTKPPSDKPKEKKKPTTKPTEE